MRTDGDIFNRLLNVIMIFIIIIILLPFISFTVTSPSLLSYWYTHPAEVWSQHVILVASAVGSSWL